MHLSIINCPDQYFTPFVERATDYYFGILLPNKRIKNNVRLTITFTDEIETLGYASITGWNTRREPREFEIEINSNSPAATMLKVLAHECVHIKQYVNHETNDQLDTWCGEPFDYEKTDYWDHPWEIEAHGREDGLFTKFATVEKLWEVFHGVQNPSTPVEKQPLGWKASPSPGTRRNKRALF